MIRELLCRLGLQHCRTRVPALVFLSIILISQLQRLALLWMFPERLEGVSGWQVVRAFAVGLRFDLVVAGMLVIPLLPIMFTAPPRLIEKRAFKLTVAVLSGSLLAVTALVTLADLFFFQEFGLRLNHQIFHYLPNAGNAYIYHEIWDRFPVIPVLAGVVASGVCAGWLTCRLGFDDRYNVGKLWHGIVWPVAFSLGIFLAIRGTVSSQAINTGPAFFSSSLPLSQLTLNGLFTLRQAWGAHLTKRVPMNQLYDLLDPDLADHRVQDMVYTDHDVPALDPVNPLHRVTRTERPRRDLNVVLAVLESMHWAYVGHLGGRPGLTPNLDELARQGVHTEYAYAVGGRTQRGFAGIISSFPDLPIASATTRDEVVGKFITLPGLLKDRGYQTLFIYGGPAHRDHRQTYLGSNGIDRFIVEDDLPVRTFRTKLGYNDRDLLQSTVTILNGLPEDKPFFALLLTLTFHRPYAFPGSEEDDATEALDRQLAAVRFTDSAIGQFIETARQQPWFDDTVFIFVADHAGGLLEHPKGPSMYRIPMVFYGPRIDGLEPRRIEGVRSQMDLAPTVLGLLGGDVEHCFFGRDMLATEHHPGYAIALTGSEEIIFYSAADEATVISPHGGNSNHHVRFDPLTGRIQSESDPTERDQEAAVAVIQMACRLFDQQRFNIAATDTDVAALTRTDAQGDGGRTKHTQHIGPPPAEP